MKKKAKLFFYPLTDSQTLRIFRFSISYFCVQRRRGKETCQALGESGEAEAEAGGARRHGIGKDHRAPEFEVRKIAALF